MGVLKGIHFVETRKNSLVSMALNRRAIRNADGKKVFKDGINQRATLKLNMVCQHFVDAVDGNAEIYSEDLLQKELCFHGVDYLDDFKLHYYSKNSIFARVFDLIVEAGYENPVCNIDDDIEIAVKQKGTMKNKEFYFVALDNTLSGNELALRLNECNLMKDRLFYIEALDFKIMYTRDSGKWTVALGTGKGSTVWSLIPPVLMLVEIDKVDAIKIIELFQLAIFEIKHYLEK